MHENQNNHTKLQLLNSKDDPHNLHYFPTRRSSDLFAAGRQRGKGRTQDLRSGGAGAGAVAAPAAAAVTIPSRADRKSTRLNSSHGYISYAVFCLKKKKKLSIQ